MDPLDSLKRRAGTLGNHYKKYLYSIERNIGSLVDALDYSGKLMQVHLWHSSYSPAEEMKIIGSLPGDTKYKVQHLSCYYALQYLHMIFRNMDIFELEITSKTNSTDVYHHFIIQIGNDFRDLSKAYLSNLIDIYLPAKNRPKFFVCSVGTKADQDDIDIGIITDENSDVTELNRTFQKITQNMLVFATPLHLYLSEHVGSQVYTTTISEYKKMLNSQIQDIVMISELLNASMVYGDKAVFKRFQKEVISRYFYHPNRNLRFHEGFLRGILGEIRSLLISPPQTDAISPKDDVLRMLKSILYAKRTICNIENVQGWDILKELIEKEPKLRSEYELLFKALAFLEMFKFLVQLYIVQEDTFQPGEIDPAQLSIIAGKMGYAPIGTVSAWEQLVIDYYRYVKEVRRLCDFLLEDITNHLSSISIIVKMFEAREKRDNTGKYKGSLPLDFIAKARFFTGTKYWEDVLNLVETNPYILDDFIAGLDALNEGQRNKVIQRYVEWSQYSSITLIRLITILGKRQENVIGNTIFHRMSSAFLEYTEKLPYTTERLCRIFSHYPQYIHEFLQLLPESQFCYLDRILTKPVINDRLKEYQLQLKELCLIHKWSGQYFHRFFHRVISSHPEYLKSITDPEQLSKIASGLLAMVDVYPSPQHKKQVLGNYYDLEFLKIGIGTMRGTEIKISNREFTEFCDNYIQELFDICVEEIEQEDPYNLPNTDTFAILAAGGHARKQAYDDDYDLIAIVADEDCNLIKRATKIITRMNREILKRGVLPHYRLGEILGSFVNSVDQIIEYLSSDNDENFIDLSQLLGARIIIGSEEMRRIINDKILEPFVFKRKSFYIEKMIQEIFHRQNVMDVCSDGSCSLKETKGGLRDIEAIALMLKALLDSTESISDDFFIEIKSQFREIEEELEILSRSVYFLRTVRNLYRLMVSAEDKIQEEHLYRLAYIFQQSTHPEWGSSELIMRQIQDTLAQSASAGSTIINYIRQKFN